jgi:hypothetical protein
MPVRLRPEDLVLPSRESVRPVPVKSGAVVLFIFVGNVGIKPATTPLINR